MTNAFFKTVKQLISIYSAEKCNKLTGIFKKRSNPSARGQAASADDNESLKRQNKLKNTRFGHGRIPSQSIVR